VRLAPQRIEHAAPDARRQVVVDPLLDAQRLGTIGRAGGGERCGPILNM
jgi:hypothetical protein